MVKTHDGENRGHDGNMHHGYEGGMKHGGQQADHGQEGHAHSADETQDIKIVSTHSVINDTAERAASILIQ